MTHPLRVVKEFIRRWSWFHCTITGSRCSRMSRCMCLPGPHAKASSRTTNQKPDYYSQCLCGNVNGNKLPLIWWQNYQRQKTSRQFRCSYTGIPRWSILQLALRKLLHQTMPSCPSIMSSDSMGSRGDSFRSRHKIHIPYVARGFQNPWDRSAVQNSIPPADKWSIWSDHKGSREFPGPLSVEIFDLMIKPYVVGWICHQQR